MVARKGSVTITRGVVSQINWMQLQSWTPTLGYRWKGERAPDRIGDRGPADRVKTVLFLVDAWAVPGPPETEEKIYSARELRQLALPANNSLDGVGVAFL